MLMDIGLDAFQPGLVTLLPSVPNPFGPHATLEFHLPSPGLVRLAVYDVAGRRVTSLIDRRMDAGTHRALWDGTDETGRTVASGVYFLRLDACGQTRQRKAVLLR